MQLEYSQGNHYSSSSISGFCHPIACRQRELQSKSAAAAARDHQPIERGKEQRVGDDRESAPRLPDRCHLEGSATDPRHVAVVHSSPPESGRWLWRPVAVGADTRRARSGHGPTRPELWGSGRARNRIRARFCRGTQRQVHCMHPPSSPKRQGRAGRRRQCWNTDSEWHHQQA